MTIRVTKGGPLGHSDSHRTNRFSPNRPLHVAYWRTFDFVRPIELFAVKHVLPSLFCVDLSVYFLRGYVDGHAHVAIFEAMRHDLAGRSVMAGPPRKYH